MTEKEQHLDIREKLQSLPSVKASDDFVLNLQRRINLAEAQPSTQIHKKHQEKLEEGFFAKLFGGRNAWMVPAMGVTAVVFLVFIWIFVIQQNNTTSDTSNNQTLSQDQEQTPESKEEGLTSNDEQKDNVGETLKTKLPGTEITSTFGYTDSRSDLDRGMLEGGITDKTDTEQPDRIISKPTVTMTEDEETESPAPSMEVRGMKKEEEKSTMKTGVMKDAKKKTETKSTDSLGNNTSEEKIKSSDEGKRVTRNLIDKTDLENLQEKVEEGVK